MAPDQERVEYDAQWMTEEYTRLPNCVLDDDELSVSARFLYTKLLSYAWNGKHTCFPGQRTLANCAGVTPRTIRTWLTELEDRGLIEIDQRGQNKTNVYVIKDPLEVYGDEEYRSVSQGRPENADSSNRNSTSGRSDTTKDDRNLASGSDRNSSSGRTTDEVPEESNEVRTQQQSGDVVVSAEELNPEQQSLIKRLENIGVWFDRAVELVSRYPERTEQYIDALEWESPQKRNSGAFAATMIESGNYDMSAYQNRNEGEGHGLTQSEEVERFGVDYGEEI